jgi:DNA polymerase III epsilon subunit-like protein
MVNVCIDLETSHLDPVVGKILQMTMMAYDEDFKIYSKIDTYIRPYDNHFDLIKRAIEEPEDSLGKDLRSIKKAMSVNNISVETLEKAPSPMEARNMFLTWWSEELKQQEIYPLGQNFDKFDWQFLMTFLGRDKIGKYFTHHSRDCSKLLIGMMDAGYFPDLKSVSLKKACDYFDIDYIPHDSYGDVYATIRLWQTLINKLN